MNLSEHDIDLGNTKPIGQRNARCDTSVDVVFKLPVSGILHLSPPSVMGLLLSSYHGSAKSKNQNSVTTKLLCYLGISGGEMYVLTSAL